MTQLEKKKIELFPELYQALSACYLFTVSIPMSDEDFSECQEILNIVRTAMDKSERVLSPEPFQINTRFATVCVKCGKEIQKGERILYIPARKKACCLQCANEI